MDNLTTYLRGIVRTCILALSLSFMGWAIFEEWRPYFAGLAIGIAVSMINIAYLSVKIKQLADIAEQKQRRRFNLGFLTRAAAAVIAVWVALRFPQVDLYATAAGLFFAQVATLLLGLAGIGKKQ